MSNKKDKPITGIEHKYEILKQSKSNSLDCKDAISGWINDVNIRIEVSKRYNNDNVKNIEEEYKKQAEVCSGWDDINRIEHSKIWDNN